MPEPSFLRYVANVQLSMMSALCFVSRIPMWRLAQRHALIQNRTPLHRCRALCSSPESDAGSNQLDREIAAARREKRPYRIDKAKLTPVERQALRLQSRAIPLVADSDPLDIIFEDDTFLVVNKPAFIKMHPSHRFMGGSLLNRAIGYLGYAPLLLHRLDMVVLAKKRKVCTPIMRQFERGEVEKQYLCVVDGVWTKPIGYSFTVNAPIQRHDVSFVREVGDSKDDFKTAITHFTILDKSPMSKMMLLRAAPKTGRTHQIRVHASHFGLPIVGDDLYNPKERNMYPSYDEISEAAENESLVRYADGNPLRKGLKLHAWKIALINPETKRLLSFCASAPGHMAWLLERAEMSVPQEQ